MDDAPDRIARELDDLGGQPQGPDGREWTLRVPSAKRGSIAAGITLGERTLTVRAFVLRGPDRRHEEVYRRLLHKNLAGRVWRFALDDVGDIFAVADLPLAGLEAGELDGLLGALSTLVDETYESLVRMGFDVPEGTRFGPPPGAEG